jgi:hypothetical protein
MSHQTTDQRVPSRAFRLAVIFAVFGITGMLALLFSRLVLQGLFG